MTLAHVLKLALTTICGMLAVCGVLVLLNPGDPALMVIIVQLLALLIMVGPLWIGRRPTLAMLLPAPPWRHAAQHSDNHSPRQTSVRWMLMRLRLRAALIDPPPAPPAYPTLPPKRRVVAKAAPLYAKHRRRHAPRRRPALTIPLPTLDIEICRARATSNTPGERARYAGTPAPARRVSAQRNAGSAMANGTGAARSAAPTDAPVCHSAVTEYLPTTRRHRETAPARRHRNLE